ncbi:MAG: hypothetical protein IKT37_02370 [Clostridia bacterium]|nr:hypothetical protein [Clostridia bacterium]
MKNKKQVFGIAFVAQAVTCLVLSIILWNKNKVLARTFAVVSALGGVAGTYFLLSDRVQKKLASCFSDAEDFEDDFEDFDVSEDDILCTFEGEDEDLAPMPAL